MTIADARCDGCGGWLPVDWYELTGVVSGPAGEFPMPTELEEPPVYCDRACCVRDLEARGFSIGEPSGSADACDRCGSPLRSARYDIWGFHPFTKEGIPEPLQVIEPRAFCAEACAREALAVRGLMVRSLDEVFASRSRTVRARVARRLSGLRLRAGRLRGQ